MPTNAAGIKCLFKSVVDIIGTAKVALKTGETINFVSVPSEVTEERKAKGFQIGIPKLSLGDPSSLMGYTGNARRWMNCCRISRSCSKKDGVIEAVLSSIAYSSYDVFQKVNKNERRDL